MVQPSQLSPLPPHPPQPLTTTPGSSRQPATGPTACTPFHLPGPGPPQKTLDRYTALSHLSHRLSRPAPRPRRDRAVLRTTPSRAPSILPRSGASSPADHRPAERPQPRMRLNPGLLHVRLRPRLALPRRRSPASRLPALRPALHTPCPASRAPRPPCRSRVRPASLGRPPCNAPLPAGAPHLRALAAPPPPRLICRIGAARARTCRIAPRVPPPTLVRPESALFAYVSLALTEFRAPADSHILHSNSALQLPHAAPSHPTFSVKSPAVFQLLRSFAPRPTLSHTNQSAPRAPHATLQLLNLHARPQRIASMETQIPRLHMHISAAAAGPDSSAHMGSTPEHVPLRRPKCHANTYTGTQQCALNVLNISAYLRFSPSWSTHAT